MVSFYSSSLNVSVNNSHAHCSCKHCLNFARRQGSVPLTSPLSHISDLFLFRPLWACLYSISILHILLYRFFPPQWKSAAQTEVNSFRSACQQSTCQRERGDWEPECWNSVRKKMTRLKFSPHGFRCSQFSFRSFTDLPRGNKFGVQQIGRKVGKLAKQQGTRVEYQMQHLPWIHMK